jgi:dipeptidyl aminopeptidase/acylaminoacyl peptidase
MRLFAFLLAALILAAPAQSDEPRRFTGEDVFNLEWATDPQVSPDGKAIVYARAGFDIMSDQVRSALWEINLATGLQAPLVVGRGSYSQPSWSPDGTRLMYFAAEDAGPELRVYYLEDGRSASLGRFAAPPGQAVWSPDGRNIAFVMFTPKEGPSLAKPSAKPKGAEWAEPVKVFDTLVIRRDGRGEARPGANQLYVIPSEGGAARKITDLKEGFSSPKWLSSGQIIGVGNLDPKAELDPVESNLLTVDLETGAVEEITSLDGPESGVVVRPAGGQIAFLGYEDKVLSYQMARLRVAAPDGSGVRPIAASFDRAFSSLAYHPDGRSLLALSEDRGDQVLIEIGADGGVKEITREVGGTSIGRPYASGSFSVGGTGRNPVIAYTHVSPYRPAEVAVIEGGKRRILTDLNRDALDPVTLARIEEITVASSHDGLPIQAWVAYPPGHQKGESWPMIMEIHGGPFAMYGPVFAAEIQRYAAEGYVTVYVNPRGSTGYGEAFAQKIDDNYPGQDYDDLISVVDALIARGDVDPARLFVTGGSGGGVLTAWIIGKTDRFAAAGVIKPVINWATMALSADIAAYVRRHWIREDPWTVEGRARYWQTSPLSLVENVSTPTLVMVGEEDWRTPPWESEQYYSALKMLEVDTVLVRVPGASHSIAARPSHLNAKVDNIMGWFARYDPKAAGKKAE